MQIRSIYRYRGLRLILAILMAVLLGLAAHYSLRPVKAQSPLSGNEKIGPDVITTLQTTGEARVVIALVEPSALQAQKIDLAQARGEIAVQQAEVLASLSPLDFRLKYQYQAVPALAGAVLTEAGLQQLAAHPQVRKIDLDVGGRGGLANSVPLIGATAWHTDGITGTGGVVAVLDSGLDTDHSDLAAALIHQACFGDDDFAINGSGFCPNGSDRQFGAGAAEDDAGHGTHVSGIISSRGNQSAVGVAPGTSIVAIKVTAGPTFSGIFYSFSEIVAALDFIINNRPDVQVINMSLVTNATFAGDCDNATSWTMAGASAINTLRANGVVAFASSGNTGSGTEMAAPACLRNVISVGATDNADSVAGFTSSNSATDIMAPGVSILSDDLANSTRSASGTSMASPHAAGCAALFIATGVAVTPDQIEARLESSPVQVADGTNGLTFPRIDCAPRPPTTVVISGPTTGLVGTSYSFVAAVSPLTATQPLTYVWQVSGQTTLTQSGGLSDTASFSWPEPGQQTITVIARNVSGAITQTHQITLNAVAPASLSISGPTTGLVETAYSFVASVSPLTTTQPLTYVWQVSGQTTLTQSGGLSDTASFSWPEPGQQTITVTARNVSGAITQTHRITISAVSPTSLSVSGPMTGVVETAYSFVAAVSPLTTTQPLTYVWQVSGQTTLTQSAGLSDTASFSWPEPGQQTITVTVNNIAGSVTGAYSVTIRQVVYLPLILK